jgi:hypothetical protein
LDLLFINTENKRPPNKPSYVKSKKFKIDDDDDDDNDDDDDDDDNDDDDDDDNKDDDDDDTKDDDNKDDDNKDGAFEVNTLTKHIPKWGMQIAYNNKNLVVTNTCSIDYYLLALWVLSKIRSENIKNIPILFTLSMKLEKIISLIERLNWKEARKIWIFEVLNIEDRITSNKNIRTLSLFGTESNMVINPFYVYQSYNLYQICSGNCENNGSLISNDSSVIFFKKINDIIEMYYTYRDKCNKCRIRVSHSILFHNYPQFLFIESIYNNIFFDEIPKQINIENSVFKLLCVTTHKMDHFKAIFNLFNREYLIDDLGPLISELTIQRQRNDVRNSPVTVSFYYLFN